jgi:hypothetical protein
MQDERVEGKQKYIEPESWMHLLRHAALASAANRKDVMIWFHSPD